MELFFFEYQLRMFFVVFISKFLLQIQFTASISILLYFEVSIVLQQLDAD